jgi:hypothetical protein
MKSVILQTSSARQAGSMPKQQKRCDTSSDVPLPIPETKTRSESDFPTVHNDVIQMAKSKLSSACQTGSRPKVQKRRDMSSDLPFPVPETANRKLIAFSYRPQ